MTATMQLDDRTGAVREAPAVAQARVVDYDAPADFYAAKQQRQMRYYPFRHASLAIQFANEGLTEAQFRTCSMDVGDERFSNSDIRRLYEAEDYPLPRTSRKAEGGHTVPTEPVEVRPRTRLGAAGASSPQRGEGRSTLRNRTS